ncbi:radical SAM protein [Spirillospora sp. NBC_00431]
MRLLTPQPGDAIAVIAKLPGEVCNINCHYCFERRKPYPGARYLSPSTLRRFLRLAAGRPLAVTLHGGEPLIVGREAMLALLREFQRYDAPLKLGLQTNGLMLDEEWLDLFAREWPDLTIGISLDGDEVANGHRVDHRDRPTFGRVLDTLALLSDRDIKAGAVMVVTRRALGRAPEALRTFARFRCVRLLKLASCLDYSVSSRRYPSPSGRTILELNPAGQGMPGWATTPAEYVEFVEQAIAFWRDEGYYRNFLLEPVTSIIRTLSGKPTDFTEFSDRKEPFIVTLYPDGRIGSSDHFGMPQSLLGQVDEIGSLDEILDLCVNPRLRDRLTGLMQVCAGCSHRETCRGGSLADRLRYDTGELAEEYCASRRRLVDFVRSTVVAS